MKLLSLSTARQNTLLACSAMILMLCLWPFRLAQAAPLLQTEAQPLLLGEFGSASLTEGDAGQDACLFYTSRCV